MEPIVSSAAAVVLRPTPAVQNELAGVLRDGRLLAGEVLRNQTDGSLLIAIGKFQVPAQSDVQLQPGRKFLFRVVVDESGQASLRVLDPDVPEEPGLLRALRSVVGLERPVGEILRELAASLRGQLQGGTPGAPPNGSEELAGLRALLARVTAHAAGPGTTGEELRQLLQGSGLRYEAALAEAARGGATPGQLAALRGDLKAELVRALAELPEGAAREAVARALAGVEAEQLLNAARQRAGEPFVWSLPFPDGTSWTNVDLHVMPRRERDGDGSGAGEGDGGPMRVVVGVDFEHTGPIRIDLFGNEDALTVRLLVTRESVADRIRRDFDAIADFLGRGRRPVQLLTRVGSPDEVAVGDRPLDIGFLREHHLMDLRG